MIHKAAIKEKISELLRNEISLEQFEDWLSSAAWSMHSDSSAEAIELASSIHHLLSERDDHILNESDLRRELLAILNDVVHASVVLRDAPMTSWVIRWSSQPSPLVLRSAQV